jgi:hypothetical protein
MSLGDLLKLLLGYDITSSLFFVGFLAVVISTFLDTGSKRIAVFSRKTFIMVFIVISVDPLMDAMVVPAGYQPFAIGFLVLNGDDVIRLGLRIGKMLAQNPRLVLDILRGSKGKD